MYFTFTHLILNYMEKLIMYVINTHNSERNFAWVYMFYT